MAFSVLIIMLLVFALLLGGLITGIVLWAGGGRRSGEMACGGCGYSVRGLEQFNCPECGADLREVGIAGGVSGGRRTFGVVLTVACGIVLVSCCGLSAFSMLFAGVSSSRPVSAPAPVYTSPAPSTSPSDSASGSDADAGEPADAPEAEGDGPEPGGGGIE